ncbi:MAG: hypothetical protein JO288_20930 [Hyphomicrobiales bacterium]|nr:hypothetical protein [Hyphomicrobiales bacterium]
MSKGYAAEETKAALARSAALIGSADEFVERFAAMVGQFSAAGTAGELGSGRELALTLLRQAEDAGQVWASGVAYWWLGMGAYWRGDFVEARTHCDRAIESRDPNPDPKALERFGDLSVYPAQPLAWTMWQLGEVERARIDRLGC